MRKSLLAVALVLSVAFPLMAQSNDVGVWYATARLGNTTTGDSSVNFDNATGYSISYNHFWSGAISTEVAASWLRGDASLALQGTTLFSLDRFKFRPITANVQWHFARGAMFSPYVGAGVAHVTADDLTGAGLDALQIGPIHLESKTNWDANAGLNINLGKVFAVAIDGKYIPYQPNAAPAADPTDRLKLKLDPLVLSAGLRLKF